MSSVLDTSRSSTKTAELPPAISPWKALAAIAVPRFHVRMAWASAILLIISVAGCKLTETHTDLTDRAIGVVAVLAALMALPVYWHDKKRPDLRDATLTLPWAALVAALLPFPLLIAARLRMPLQDSLLAHLDEVFGIRIPSIVSWASHHWLGSVLNRSYGALIPLLAIAFVVPALAGKLKYAQEFVSANLIAFAIATPLFALLPAVGPWFHYHVGATAEQLYCQADLLSIRLPGPYTFMSQGAGIVSFPSFHVIWAVLCARALWGFQRLRIPLALLSGMIVISTMTTGWHYFSDVLAGLIIAFVSILIAASATRS